MIGGEYQWGAEMAEKPLLQQKLPGVGYGEQCADTDGLALARADVAALCERVAALEAAIEIRAHQAKRWEDRCIQLTAERDALRTELAQRMALPANALRHSR